MSDVLRFPKPESYRADVLLELDATELAAMTQPRRQSMLERLYAVGLTPREIVDEMQ